jgi:hypothetical protein
VLFLDHAVDKVLAATTNSEHVWEAESRFIILYSVNMGRFRIAEALSVYSS